MIRWRSSWSVVLALALALALVVPASALAYVEVYRVRGYNVYALDNAGTVTPAYWAQNMLVGDDLFGGEATPTARILAIKSESAYGYSGDLLIDAGAYFKNAFYHSSGIGAIERHLDALPVIPDGSFYSVVVRCLGFYLPSTLGWRPGTVSDEGATVYFNSQSPAPLRSAGKMSGWGPNWKIDPTAHVLAAVPSAGDSGFYFSDAIFTIKRVGSTYTWWRSTTKKAVYGAFMMVDGKQDHGTTTTLTGTYRVTAGTSLYWGHARESDGAIVAPSEAAAHVRQSVILSSGTSTSSVIYEMLTGDIEAWHAGTRDPVQERQNELDDQDTFYQGGDDLPAVAHYHPVIPSTPSLDSSITSGVANDIDAGLFDGPWSILQGKIDGILGGFADFFWWTPFFAEDGW